MDKFLVILAWLTENSDNIVALLIAVGALVEGFRKALPTKTDKSALQIIGEFVTKVLSVIPSNTKKSPAPTVGSEKTEEKK